MSIKQIMKLFYFRINFFSKKVTIRSGCNISLNSTFEGCNVIGQNSLFAGKLGFGSYIGENSNVLGCVGRYCSIASDVKVLSGTHPLSSFVSTSPVFYSLLRQNNISFVEEQYFEEFLYADKVNKHVIIVGNDVWIGAGATILGGVTIGDGAVVLANATVTKNVPPYAIVAGTPAKIINRRFDDETINFLLNYKWWNQPTDWLKKRSRFFRNIDFFKEEFDK